MTKKTSDWEIVEESIPTAQVGMLIPPMGQQYMSGRTGDIINTPKQIPLEKNEDVLKIRKDKKEQQLQRVGYSQKEAKALAQHPKLLESAEDRITDREYKDYRISMHPDYNPNKSFEEQETLLSDNSLRTRVLRGRNTLTTSGSPAGNFATGLLTAPGSSFANMTMDAENRYVKPGVKQGLMNFGLDALDVFPTATGGLVNKSVNKVKGIINNGKILKQHWLKGYKEIPKPKSNFKSEIDWGKWNKEIPENTQLMKEYNAIDYRKNPLSDKEKEMYQWFDEQMRFDKLPETTNKQSIEVLDNFKQRIKTPEGQKRLKELGITEEQLLQDLKIVEDPNTYGYYRGLNKNTIAINPNHPLPKKVVRHEIEHGVQNALRKSKINKAIDGTPAEKLKALEINTTEIDDILSELTLRREGTPNKVWNKINTNETVNINDYKSLINNKQNATDYFLTGSDGAEKSAFLGEVQQYMMDAGKIPKNSYVQITPEMVKETMVDAMFDEKTGGKYLRLFNIIKADPKNYEIISKGLNKMLSITPLIGAGAYMQNKEYKNGGAIGNNGMFDMTNPNIYKALIPATAGVGVLSQQETPKKGFKNGGRIESDWEIIN